MKKYLPLATILILAFAVYGKAQPCSIFGKKKVARPMAPQVTASLSNDPAEQTQLSQKETELWTAWKNKDTKRFQALVSSDGVMVGETGAESAAAAAEEAQTCDLKSFSLTNWRLTKFGLTTALLTYKATQDATCGGTALPATVWVSTLWVKQRGIWKAAFQQATPTN
ncbi:MAG TPA: nuclear transport factor 2 family protein [Pyrinomonadaceae bacterium]|jgi:hypothetical protein|nr:nuclear transport factor 2 family protein [Pyrinomonadaceae bacterium]